MQSSIRAMQVWQILIAAAHNRQSLTYTQLAAHLGFRGAGVFNHILALIVKYCESESLPKLTCIVVNQMTGLPGDFPIKSEDLGREREAVYQQNWYALSPAQISDFEAHQN